MEPKHKRFLPWRLLFPLTVLSIALALGVIGRDAGPVHAQPGTGLAQIVRPAGCTGIGVAFDGTNVLYTCSVEAKVRKTNLASADLGFVDTADAGGNAVSVDAIAWDPNEVPPGGGPPGALWGGDLDGAGNCRIWTINMTTGLAALQFSFVDPHGGCNFFFFDGLTVDTVTNTLWLSPDVHTFIHHYTKGGVEIVADVINFAALTPAGEPDVNSGLAIGIDGTLYGGTDGFGKIVRINNPGPGASFGGVFSTVTGRDEDLECGPLFKKTDASTVETILSADLNQNKIDVLEAPEGTCKSPVEPDEPPVVDCVETVNPHGNTVPPAGSTTLPGAKGGQNEDGYYELTAKDDKDPNPQIFVIDKGKDGVLVTADDTTFPSPPPGFASGTKIKYTEANGAKPSIKKIGSSTGQAGAVDWHITGNGDFAVVAIDAAGNQSKPLQCHVPPPPK